MALVGAWLLFIIEEWPNFLTAPLNYIFTGAGFTWYGGLFGGVIAVSWVVRKTNIPWVVGADIGGLAVGITYGVGRTAATSPATATGARDRRTLGSGVHQRDHRLGSSFDRRSLSARHPGSPDADLRIHRRRHRLRHSLVFAQARLRTRHHGLALSCSHGHIALHRRILAHQSGARFRLIKGEVV